MKTLVNALANVVRRAPWIVIGVTIVVTLILGSFASQFQPAEDQNAAFAPDAPELTASSYIGDTFGAVSRMQVLTTSSTDDAITLDALNAALALDDTVRASDSAELLVDSEQAPAVISYLAPVLLAVDGGAPFPTSDAEVKALYTSGLEAAPPEFRSFLLALLSDDANVDAATAEHGLSAITYRSTDDLDEQAARALGLAAVVNLAPTPDSITLDPFSVELIFGDSEAFEKEILRLFAAAALIILLILAIIFVVKPKGSRGRSVFILGLVLMTIGAGIAIAPGLAQIFPDLFPESWGNLELGPVLLTALVFYAAAFVLWALMSRRLRRTTADTIVTFLTIIIAIQWMNGYGFLRFEDASPMAQILPILLIGLGVDYAIHMTARYRQELVAGNPVDQAMRTAIRTVGVALVLATLTTAIGFLTNVTNDLPALAEFGELAAVGIAASFLLMLTFVPAVRELLDRRAEKHDRLDTAGIETGDARILPRLVGKTAILPRRFATATLVVALGLTGLGAYSMTGLSTEFSFLDFVPTNSPLRATAVTVIERFDFPETTSVVVQGDVATGAAWNTMVGAFADSAGVPDVQTIDFPSGETVPTGPTFIGIMLGLLDPSSPTADAGVQAAALSAGLDARAFPLDANLVPVYDAAVAANPVVMANVLASDADGYVSTLFNFDTVAGESGAGDLGTGLNDAFAVTADAGLASVATSVFIINDLVIQSLTDSQLSSLLLTMGAALLLLVVNFFFESRRPMLGVITTIPVVIVVIMVFGVMAALGIAFGPVTATISALGIGIGIPYMIHVTQRYLEERLEWSDENEAIEQTLTHTGGALAGSAVTTMFGFGILMTSTTIPFRQFGFVLAYTILLALLAAVLILPSMLVLWDRWHRRHGDKAVDVNLVQDLAEETP